MSIFNSRAIMSIFKIKISYVKSLIQDQLCQFLIQEQLCQYLINDHLCQSLIQDQLCQFLLQDQLCQFLLQNQLCRCWTLFSRITFLKYLYCIITWPNGYAWIRIRISEGGNQLSKQSNYLHPYVMMWNLRISYQIGPIEEWSALRTWTIVCSPINLKLTFKNLLSKVYSNSSDFTTPMDLYS